MDLIPSSESVPSASAPPKIIGITDYTVVYDDGATAKISLKTPLPVKPFSDMPKGSSNTGTTSKPFSI